MVNLSPRKLSQGLASLVLSCILVSGEIISDLRNICDSSNVHDCLEVHAPGSASFARFSAPYNLRMEGVTPAAVVLPRTVHQVSEIVKAAVRNSNKVVARSGGHSYVANGLGGSDNGAAISIDLRYINQVTVDKLSGTAIIGAGNRLGNVVQSLGEEGRALPHGTCPYVGIGGHTGYGGYGFTSRQWGLALDPIYQLEVVLANGTVKTVGSNSTGDDFELFWGLKGASSSFGIVTNIYAHTFQAPASVTTFTYTWDLSVSDAVGMLLKFQDEGKKTTLPKQFGGQARLLRGSAKGRVTFVIFGAWYDDHSRYDAVISRFLHSTIPPATTDVRIGSYIDSVILLGERGSLDTGALDRTDTFYAKSLMTPEGEKGITETTATAFIHYSANEGYEASTNWFVGIELWGENSEINNNTAAYMSSFEMRKSIFAIQFYAYSRDSRPPFPHDGIQFLNGMVNTLTDTTIKPQDDYRMFSNYIDDQVTNWEAWYYNNNYNRLVQLKNKVDKDNLFKSTHSVGLTEDSTLPPARISAPKKQGMQKIIDLLLDVEEVLIGADRY